MRQALGRTLAEDIEAREYVPDFDRSTVDGYAVRAGDTFGCTDAIPAILPVQAAVLMGEGADFTLNPGECAAVPTGGAIPAGADSVVMMEYTEDYGDGSIGVSKAAAPGMNMIFRGGRCVPRQGDPEKRQGFVRCGYWRSGGHRLRSCAGGKKIDGGGYFHGR